MPRQRVLLLLTALAILEAYFQTYMVQYGNKDLAAFGYLLTGIGIGILPLFIIPAQEAESSPTRTQRILHRALYGLLALAIFYFGVGIIQAQPLDYKYADMLPIMKKMAERWLVWGDVYAIIPEIWGGMQPIYLPAMWLPYTLPIGLGMDMRWMSLLFLAIGAATCVRLFKQPSFWPFLPLAVLFAFILLDTPILLVYTEEPIVIGFYLFLAWALMARKPVWIGVFLACCLLSRYTLVFWAAAFLGYQFFFGDRKASLISAGTALAVGLILLIISQGIGQLELFYSLKDNYLKDLSDPDKAWGMKDIVARNIGVARFLGYNDLPLLHACLVLGSLYIPFRLFVWYHLRLRDRIALPLFALCCLKLCLVYFYNMNPQPYAYLFFTSTFLSSAIIGHYYISKTKQAALSTD
jgi:hypothetical protein